MRETGTVVLSNCTMGWSYLRVDLIPDTRHLCTRFRIDEIKAHVVFQGGKQKIKFADVRNHGRLCLFSHNETTI